MSSGPSSVKSTRFRCTAHGRCPIIRVESYVVDEFNLRPSPLALPFDEKSPLRDGEEMPDRLVADILLKTGEKREDNS